MVQRSLVSRGRGREGPEEENSIEAVLGGGMERGLLGASLGGQAVWPFQWPEPVATSRPQQGRKLWSKLFLLNEV